MGQAFEVSIKVCGPSRYVPKSFFPILFFWIILAAITASTLQPSIGVAEDQAAQQEYVIKAYFLLNFTKYISWPESSFETEDAPFKVCILGGEYFDASLNAFKGKSYKRHPFEVQSVEDSDDIPECHLLFVCTYMQEELNDVMGRTYAKPILTVGEAEDFVRRGGIINFFIHEGKVRFEINKKAAEASSLEISSQLLKLAKIYEE